MPSVEEQKESYLIQDIRGVSRGLRKKRNVFEGYQRAWGLQQRDTKEKVLCDPLYREALDMSRDRILLGEDQRMNLFLLMRFFLKKIPSGNIIEFGSYRGGSAIFMAYIAKALYPGTQIFSLDTFSGIQEVNKCVDANNAGDYSDVDLNSLKHFVASNGLDNIEFIEGNIENTADETLLRAGRISLAHIDCALYSSTAHSYQSVRRRMVDGGYIVFDDATTSSCIGATEVVEDLVIRRDGLNSEQIYPQFVFRIFNK